MAKLTITFRGLCLFVPAPSTGPTRIHVLLAQPKGMPHVSIRRYQERDRTWTAEELPRWVSLQFGKEDDPATMPPPSQMSSFSGLMQAPRFPEKEARAAETAPPDWEPHDHRGSHVTLHGGTLVAAEPIGVWQDANDPGAGEFFFPYILQWSGKGKGPTDANLEFWNTIPQEAPSLGPNSKESTWKAPDPVGMAKEHFKAFYGILKGTKERDLVMTRTIPPSPPPPVTEKGKLRMTSLIVSSCPSGGGDGTP